jgi:hypothetical protein
MRNLLLILFLSLGLLNFSYAGGDDRDQQLPLNSLNSEEEINEEGVPRFLQEDDEVIQDDAVQQGQKEIEELIQTKLVNQETPINTEELIESDVDSSSNTKVHTLINRYIKSDQGILIMLFLFAVSLILLFNFFVREK